MELKAEDRVFVSSTVSERAGAKLSEAVAAYLTFKTSRGAPESTMKPTRYLFQRMVRFIGDLQVRNLRPKHFSDWFYGPKGLMESGISNNTHNTYRALVKGFTEWCSKRAMTRYDLMEDVMALQVRRRRRQQPKPHILLQMLDATKSPRDRGYLAVAINTALRKSEITRLTVGDVDLDAGILYVTRSKGGEEDEIPITSDLDTELRQWLLYYAEEIEEPLRDEYYLFPAYSPARIVGWQKNEKAPMSPIHELRRLNPTSQWEARTEKVIKDAMLAVGLTHTRGEGTHTIRRAVARAYFDSMASDTGYDATLRTVAALLGHKRLSTTETYLGLSTERVRRDESMRGKPFLTAMVDDSNVTPLRQAREAR